jgi:signal transduction histidine kinase
MVSHPSSAPSRAVRAPRFPASLRAVGTAAFWLQAAHLLLDVVIGALSTFLLLSGLFFTVVLLPFALLGLPVWILTTWISSGLARLEQARYRVLLGVRVEPQPMPPLERNPLRYGGVLLRDEGVRRRGLHQLVAFPLGMLTSGVVYTMLAGGLGLLGTAVVLGFTDATDRGAKWRLFGAVLSDSVAGQVLLVVLGVLLLVLTAPVVRALAALDVAVARALLGPTPAYLARRVDELERSRARVVDAGEAERRRIERDLHDGTQQQLVALGMTLGRAKARYAVEPDGIGELLDDAHQQAKDTVTDLRRMIRGLHPPVLTDRGLDAALSAIAVRCPVPVELSVEIDERPSAAVEAIGYFVVAEALTNVAKHSGASAAAVRVRREDRGSVWIAVMDNGVGGAHPDHGTGLRGLADRVAAVDGQLSVDSPVGGPTVLTVELPCVGAPVR